MTATMTAETNHQEERKTILRELDELIDYIEQDQSTAAEQLIDPAFFIGDMDDANDLGDDGSDVPTLTAVSSEPGLEPSKQARENDPKQPGLFSARVERIKQNQEAERAPDTEKSSLGTPSKMDTESDIDQIVEDLVSESLPMLETLLRSRLKAYLQQQRENS